MGGWVSREGRRRVPYLALNKHLGLALVEGLEGGRLVAAGDHNVAPHPAVVGTRV